MASRLAPHSSEGVLTLELILARSRASDLESVKKLNVWHNKIKDISLLQSTPNLQVLNLSSNAISSLWPLRNSVALKELYLRRNALSSVSELLQLRRCGSLRFAWFAGNPLCAKFPSIKDYRIAVVKVLPQLSMLDNIVITEEERILSQPSTAPVTLGNLSATEENKENLMDKSVAAKEQLSASLEGERPRLRALSDEINKNNGANGDENNDVDEAEDDDDDNDDAYIVEQTKSENYNEFSDVDLLQSSQRFSMAESNNIRETLGLKPIVLKDGDDDVTIDDDDSGAIGGDDDYEDDSGAIDDDDDYDDDEDDLEMLNSYAEMLDDSGESFDREEQEEEHSDSVTLGTRIKDGFPSSESDNEMNPLFSSSHRTVGSGSPGTDGNRGTAGSQGTAGSHGTLGSKGTVGNGSTAGGRATNNNSQGSLLSATLLLLQNLTIEDLMEVERECERLRECHQRVEKDASLDHA